MSYSVSLLPPALENLEEIRIYLIASFGEKRAQEEIQNLLRGILILGDFPPLGKSLPNAIRYTRNFRYLIIGKDIVVYRIIDQGIFVAAIRDSRQSDRLLFQMLTPLE